jgi:fucose 4-O-acetylase-like acetyltransferase
MQFIHNKYGEEKFVDNLCEAGKQTLGIYLIQTIIFEVFFYVLSLRYNSYTVNLLSPVVSFFILGFCLLIIKAIKRNKYSQLLLLGITR